MLLLSHRHPSPMFPASGSFNGSGTSFPAGPVGWVSWEGDFMAQRTAGCSAVKVKEWVGSSANVSMAMDDSDGILNTAPLIGGQHALLGEAGEIAAVSTYGWIGQQSSSGFCDLAPSILHYNWF
jgi:hypothetical protein